MILNPRDSYKLIEKRLSFSFQRKSRTTVQYIKITLLLIVITLLTWYGKQPYNNPFQSINRIIISGNSLSFTIYSFQKDTLLVIIPFDIATQFYSSSQFPINWKCFSRTSSVSWNISPYPPIKWWVMDSIFNNKPSHSNWPSPSPVTGEGGSDISIKKINALKGQYTILNILLYGIKISVIDALEFQEAYEETIRLRESCEILLIRNADVKSSVILRSLFRPKFTVAFGKIDVCTSKYTNLFLCCLTDDTECFVFRIGPKRNVIFDSRE